MSEQTITLQHNQSALILEAGEDGEISINVAASDLESLAGALCQAIAYKLQHDEDFQTELFEMLDFDDQE